MIRIPVYQYSTHTSRGTIETPTFREQAAGPIGVIAAPDGSSLHTAEGETPKLKVPKLGREFEFFLMSASDAYQAAKSGRYGLALAKEATSRG